MLLPDELLEGSRAHPFGERRIGRIAGLGFRLIGLVEESARLGSGHALGLSNRRASGHWLFVHSTANRVAPRILKSPDDRPRPALREVFPALEAWPCLTTF